MNNNNKVWESEGLADIFNHSSKACGVLQFCYSRYNTGIEIQNPGFTSQFVHLLSYVTLVQDIFLTGNEYNFHPIISQGWEAA